MNSRQVYASNCGKLIGKVTGFLDNLKANVKNAKEAIAEQKKLIKH
ncbi:hypothetical protein [Bacillus sp. BB081]|nr:hypothetical protein [Bacillus sp. BB081]